MSDIAKKHQDQLPRLKKCVEYSYNHFKNNYDRFNEFRNFVFKTSITSSDEAALKLLGKPILEFNILEAYISRLLGEFSKQEPAILTRATDGAKNINPQEIEVIEGYMKYILTEANDKGISLEIMRDMLSGGFSVAEIYYDYINPMSFDQIIINKRADDPCFCGFDPLAQEQHKGDGEYCFKLIVKSKEQFEEEFGKEISENLKFSSSVGNFNWTYANDVGKYVLICEFFEKKKKKKKIISLSDGNVMLSDQYEQFLADWENKGTLQQPPVIVDERYTEVTTIEKYTFIDNKVLDHENTIYEYLPLIFFSGNSIRIRQGNNGSIEELTRPYIYHAKGVQKLKNFAGQTLANELENMIQHKFMAAKEGIPEDYIEAYENIQKPSVLVYNAFKDNDPNVPVPPPQPIPRVPTPPEVTNTFTLTDQITQAILGNFDPDLGKIPTNAMSGIAIQETATLNNAAAMPYINGYLSGLTQLAKINLDLILKLYKTPRTIPVLEKDGKRSYKLINQQGGFKFNCAASDIEIKVEAGVNFAIQKSRALQQIMVLMQSSKIFDQFMNQEGLPILLDNIEIRGIEGLKQSAEEWMKNLKQQQAMQQQMQMQEAKMGMMNNPVMAKMQVDKMKIQSESQDNAAKLAVEEKKLDRDHIKILADLKKSEDATEIAKVRAEAEHFSKSVDLKLKHKDMKHRHLKEAIETHHTIQESKKNKEHKEAKK